jgi:hydroxyacylglutathione hydrolase
MPGRPHKVGDLVNLAPRTGYRTPAVTLRGTFLVATACVAPVACAPPAVRPAPASNVAVALSGGPNTSMAYFARVDSGIVAIDLGWWGAEKSMRRALRTLRAGPDQVTDVFVTHSHRDHLGAWRLVRRSRFHLASAEHAVFTGQRGHRGWIPRAAERVRQTPLPRAGEVDARVFSRDTTFVFGADTLRAYLVPGHTAGSAVYLFRGTLFLGDAATYTRWGGFGPARRGYSDDARTAARNLEALWARIPAGEVRQICTAHAKCSPMTRAFLADVRR